MSRLLLIQQIVYSIEYLIKQFADAINKKAGEFYTPRSVVRLMVEMLDPQEGETVYDPPAGTGGMLLAAVAHVADRGGDPRTFFGKLYGQEKNLTTAAVARIVNDIDEIVRLVRFPGWQTTSAGGREVRKALRKSLFKYKLHQDTELFEKAYEYIKQYY